MVLKTPHPSASTSAPRDTAFSQQGTKTMPEGLTARLSLSRDSFQLDAELSLPPTGVSVLFGQSGSGKTTLLRCLAGLERADGEVHFRDQTWQNKTQYRPTWKRPLAYVFQEASLLDHLTAQGNLDFAIKRARGQLTRQEQTAIIDMLGIGHALQRYPAQLSGGERQRVAIARALLSKPSLLLMDEPLASLDEQRKQEILPYLEQLRSELALPIVYVTHSVTEVARLADYLVAMENGRIVAQGTLSETLADPAFPLKLGEEAGVVLDGMVQSHDAQWHLACIRVADRHDIWLRDSGHAIGKVIRARILARDVSLSNTRHTDSSIVNAWPCIVEAITDDSHPALALVKVRAGDTPLLSRMTRRSVEHLQLTPGKAVWAQVKSAALV